MDESKTACRPGFLPVPILVAVIMVLAVMAIHWRTSEAQEGVAYDNLCLEDAYGGKVNCTANDSGATNIEFISVTKPCQFVGDTATVRLLLTAVVGSPERYDIGHFLALDGNNAIDAGNSCYHSYLQPVSVDSNVTYSPTSGVGPFWQGSESRIDVCGDSQGNNNDITVLAPGAISFSTPTDITVLCQDSPDDPDGQVDIKIRASYKQANDSFCPDVTGAVPGTASKCGCSLFNLPFKPTGSKIGDVSAEPVLAPWLSIVALLLVFSLSASTVAVLLFRRGRDRDQE